MFHFSRAGLRTGGSVLAAASLLLASAAIAQSHGTSAGHGATEHHNFDDSVIQGQRLALSRATQGVGFGPQSPRDIDLVAGSNRRVFGFAPHYSVMNLCNIHFHEGAEHRGGEFTTYIGNGDGQGNGSGYAYDGHLSEAELAPYGHPVGASEHGSLEPGDTIEVHFVHTTADVRPGATLGACLDTETTNPELRVEAVVMVLVNDPHAADFTTLASLGTVDGYAQAPNLPRALGTPVLYTGSTTGPSYNENGSPFQVTWSVRPRVLRVNIASVEAWLGNNAFGEDHAHGVRNLVTDPQLLSPITLPQVEVATASH